MRRLYRAITNFLFMLRQSFAERKARMLVRNWEAGYPTFSPAREAAHEQFAHDIYEYLCATADCLSPLMDREQASLYFARAALDIHMASRSAIAKRLAEHPEVETPAVWLNFVRRSVWGTHIVEEAKLLEVIDDQTLKGNLRWAYHRIDGREPGQLIVLHTHEGEDGSVIAVRDYVNDPRATAVA